MSLVHIKYIHFIQQPQILTQSSINSNVWNPNCHLTSKSNIDETKSMIHSEAKFLSGCELWNQTSHVLLKYNGRTGIGEAFPFHEGKMEKKERAIGPKQVQNLSRQTPKILSFNNNPFWLMLHLPDPELGQGQPQGSASSKSAPKAPVILTENLI